MVFDDISLGAPHHKKKALPRRAPPPPPSTETMNLELENLFSNTKDQLYNQFRWGNTLMTKVGLQEYKEDSVSPDTSALLDHVNFCVPEPARNNNPTVNFLFIHDDKKESQPATNKNPKVHTQAPTSAPCVQCTVNQPTATESDSHRARRVTFSQPEPSLTKLETFSNVENVEGFLHIKPGDSSFSRFRKRYCLLNVQAKCLFYWKAKKQKDSGKAKCYTEITGVEWGSDKATGKTKKNQVVIMFAGGLKSLTVRPLGEVSLDAWKSGLSTISHLQALPARAMKLDLISQPSSTTVKNSGTELDSSVSTKSQLDTANAVGEIAKLPDSWKSARFSNPQPPGLNSENVPTQPNVPNVMPSNLPLQGCCYCAKADHAHCPCLLAAQSASSSKKRAHGPSPKNALGTRTFGEDTIKKVRGEFTSAFKKEQHIIKTRSKGSVSAVATARGSATGSCDSKNSRNSMFNLGG